MRLPINIQIFVVRKSGDSYQYLMLFRHMTLPNFWQPVSGGVEDGESIEQTARREMREETGLTDYILRDPNYWRSYEVPKHWFAVHGWEIWDITHNVAKIFIAEIPFDAVITMDPNEHNQMRWCSFEEAMAMLYWEGDKKALVRVREFLMKNS